MPPARKVQRAPRGPAGPAGSGGSGTPIPSKVGVITFSDDIGSGPLDISAFSWGVTNTTSVNLGAGSGGGAGKASFQDFHFTKGIDSTSPKIFSAVASGEHIPSAIVDVYAPGSTDIVISYKFTDVFLSSDQETGSGSSGFSSESVSLTFAKVEQTVPQGGGAAPIHAGFDISLNEKL